MAIYLRVDDAMFPDTPDVLDDNPHRNGSTHDLHDYSSSYYLYYDFGMNSQDRKVLYIIVFFFMLILLLFGLLSNVFQLHGIIRFPHIRQDVQHIFIANMTIVDILYLLLIGITHLVAVGLEALSEIYKGHNVLSLFMHLWLYLQIAKTCVLFHLASMITALAFDQYLVAVYPIVARKWRTPRNAVIVCVILWAVGLLIMIAFGLPYGSTDDNTSMSIADSVISMLFYLVPTIMTVALNMMTWYAAKHNARTSATSTDNREANNASRFTQLQEEDVDVPGALVRAQDLPNNVTITASFVIFWGIYHTIWLVINSIWILKDYNHWIFINNKDELMINIAELAVHFNLALNPLFYATCNPKFRQHLYQVAYALAGRNTRAYTDHIDETTTGE